MPGAYSHVDARNAQARRSAMAINQFRSTATIAMQAKGKTLIHDWVYENRAIYYTELNRLGAKITLADPHRVFIEGPTKLTPTEVMCPAALRPSTIILLTMLATRGKSILRNIYAIERGHEDLCGRLTRLGADISALDEV